MSTPSFFQKWQMNGQMNINEDGGNRKNKRSQLRKFYDEVLLFYNRIQGDKEKFEQTLPYIKLLRAKVYYARGRDHITDKFKDFIESCIDQIHTWEDFVVFKNFFEAFMGFYRYYNKG